MEQYSLHHLLRQYRMATGVSDTDLTNESFRLELAYWACSRQMIGEEYIKFITKLGLYDANDQCIVEVGKSEFDTLVTGNSKTSILTIYLQGLEKEFKGRIKDGYISFDSHKPLLVYNAHSSKEIMNLFFNELTFMTQNPYTNCRISNWETIPKNSKCHIILGVYGSIYDRDKENKLSMMQNFARKMQTEYIIESTTMGDSYLCAISDVKRLIKK